MENFFDSAKTVLRCAGAGAVGFGIAYFVERAGGLELHLGIYDWKEIFSFLAASSELIIDDSADRYGLYLTPLERAAGIIFYAAYSIFRPLSERGLAEHLFFGGLGVWYATDFVKKLKNKYNIFF